MKIVSFHPLFEGDDYRVCAGRDPNKADIEAIRSADAVVLPQGCRETLYRMAQDNCLYVFPNYDVRFRYPGKLGQIRLFRDLGADHPPTDIFENLAEFRANCCGPPPGGYPLVFKFAWGGEGETVFLVKRPDQLADIMELAEQYEQTGQRGFLLQAFVPPGNRALRVAVVGTTFRSYWRVGGPGAAFGAGVGNGAVIDHKADPHLQEKAVAETKKICSKTGINLAGFDFLFDPETETPLFLEINYFFGRRGLGGSKGYYPLLLLEIKRWIQKVETK